MKKAVEQETLQTLVETGTAREFRVLREGEGEAWRLELRLGAKWLPAVNARTDQILAFADCGGAVLRRVGNQGTDGRVVKSGAGVFLIHRLSLHLHNRWLLQ